jgi:glutamate--cysteine ligase
LDQTVDDTRYQKALSQQRQKLRDPALTPSAKVLATMREENIPFFRFSMNQGLAHKAHFEQLALSQQEQAFFELSVAESIQAQKNIEEADELDFASFLSEYLKIPAASNESP